MASVSMKYSASRAKKFGYASEQQLQDADRPLGEIVREEDQKRRNP
jgi:chorismate-pyruvate lyase